MFFFYRDAVKPGAGSNIIGNNMIVAKEVEYIRAVVETGCIGNIGSYLIQGKK